MTDDRLDLLLDLAVEQYEPKPGKQARLLAKLIGKPDFHSPQQRQISGIFETTFALFDQLMQTI